MVGKSVCLFLLVAIFAIPQEVSALRLDITQEKRNGYRINFRCVLDSSKPQNPTIEIVKDGDDGLMVTLRPNSKIAYGPTAKADRLQVDGHISTGSGDPSYLNVTINDPDTSDSGKYTCRAFGTGDLDQMVEEKEDGYLKVDGLQILMQRLAALEKELSTRKTQKAEARKKIQDKLNNQDGDIDSLTKTASNMTRGHDEVSGKLTKEYKNFRKLLRQDGHLVAFSAGYRNNKGLQTGQTVRYDMVSLNEGGAYDSASGIFTAPKSGLYAFYVLLMSKVNGDVHFGLEINGKITHRVRVADRIHPDQSSINTVTFLPKGYRVKVVILYSGNGGDLISTPDMQLYNTFGGYLVGTRQKRLTKRALLYQ